MSDQAAQITHSQENNQRKRSSGPFCPICTFWKGSDRKGRFPASGFPWQGTKKGKLQNCFPSWYSQTWNGVYFMDKPGDEKGLLGARPQQCRVSKQVCCRLWVFLRPWRATKKWRIGTTWEECRSPLPMSFLWIIVCFNYEAIISVHLWHNNDSAWFGWEITLLLDLISSSEHLLDVLELIWRGAGECVFLMFWVELTLRLKAGPKF